MRSLHTLTLLAVTSVIAASTVEAAAGRFDGWCFMEDVCFGASVIRDDTFGTCESNCTMTEPTRVSDMEAMLYWVECKGDGGVARFRLFISEYETYSGDLMAVAVGPSGPENLERCED